MKRIKRIITLAAFCALAILCIFCFTACNKGYTELQAPINLRIEDEELVWDEVEGAVGYTVTINDKEYDTETNSLDIFLLATVPETVYSMRVQARANLDLNNDSELSEALEYKINGWQQAYAFRLTDDGSGYEVGAADKTVVGGKIVLPQMIEGKPITKIANNAFKNCTQITGIIMPDTVTKIGTDAFRGCENLTRVRMSARLDTICNLAFVHCTNLKKVEIPASVRTIEIAAFENTGISELNIPSTVENIEKNIVGHCDNLKVITVHEGNGVYKSDGNCLIRKKDNALLFGCNNSVIPDYVESIGDRAFYFCQSLESVTIPGSVKIIEDNTFSGCGALKNVNIENGLQTIRSDTFGAPFSRCNSLERIDLPQSVTDIGFCLFYGMPALTTVTVHPDNPTYYSDGNCIMRRNDNVLVAGCVGSVIPDYITEIGDNAFYACRIKNIALPVGLKVIGYSAFRASSLESLELPEGLTTIESYGFAECKGLDYMAITLPQSITVFDGTPFSDTYALLIVEDKSKMAIKSFLITEGAAIEENGRKYVHHIKYEGIYPIYAPKRDGYVFKGWTTQQGGTEVELGAPYQSQGRIVTISYEEMKTLSKGTILYSVWERIEE